MFLEYQLDYLLWLQNLREATGGILDTFFLSITHFGEVLIPLSFLALIYWSLNKKLGEFLIVVYSFSLICNQFLKMVACIKRPWILSAKIKPVPDAIPQATGYSFPSGHTAGATSLWGGFAIWFWNNKVIRYSMIIFVLLIAFSRNYLGVHTPQDVVVSFVVGCLILIIVKKIFDFIDKKPENDVKIYVTGLIMIIFSMVYVIFKYYHLSGEDFIYYANQMKSFYQNMGCISGAFTGWILCRKFIPFSTDNISVKKKILRFVFGYMGVLVLMFYGAQTFMNDFGVCRGSFIGTFVTGIFITFLYPFVFTRVERRLEQKNKDFE